MADQPNNQPGAAFPEPYLPTEVADQVIQSILDCIDQQGLTSHQARQILARVRDLIDLGELSARKTSH